jgi:hypothetical protein
MSVSKARVTLLKAPPAELGVWLKAHFMAVLPKIWVTVARRETD